MPALTDADFNSSRRFPLRSQPVPAIENGFLPWKGSSPCGVVRVKLSRHRLGLKACLVRGAGGQPFPEAICPRSATRVARRVPG